VRALVVARGEDGLVEVTLARAPLNEVGLELLVELERLLDDLEADDGARGLLLASGLPRGFSAGADLRALALAIAERGHAAVTVEVREFLGRIGAALARLDAWPRPTCAAVHGVVFGGGLELMVACDLRVADRTARFAFPELRLGLVPGFGGLARLLRDVGQGHARELLLTGRSLNAEVARQAGLVGQVTAPGRHVEVARRAVQQAMRQDPGALAAAKALLKRPERLAADLALEVETFLRLFARPEVARALEAFTRRTDAFPYVPGAPGG
jgi:enoyl-CoA hydratase/carnithine racemase